MEDAFKILRKDPENSNSQTGRTRRSPFGESVHKPAQEPLDPGGHPALKPEQEPLNPPATPAEDRHISPATRALNQWLSQRRDKGLKGLVNVLNETLVSQFGPLKFKGNLTLIHEDGTTELANQLTLCRCGHSMNKPFCDDRHIEKEFMDSGRFSQGSHSAMPLRPSALAIKCVKNGPLEFYGRMRIHDYLGQDCVKSRGKLCRCGLSANKPFCDNSHEKAGFDSSNPTQTSA